MRHRPLHSFVEKIVHSPMLCLKKVNPDELPLIGVNPKTCAKCKKGISTERTCVILLSKFVRIRELSRFMTLSVCIGNWSLSPRSRSISCPSFASISMIAPWPTAVAPAGPAMASFRRTTCWKRKSQTTLVISSCGMNPVMDGSQGPRLFNCGCSAGCGGCNCCEDCEEIGGPFATESSRLIIFAGGASCETARCRCDHGFCGVFLICLGIGGNKFGILGHFPFVRIDRWAKIGGSLYRLRFGLGGWGLELAGLNSDAKFVFCGCCSPGFPFGDTFATGPSDRGGLLTCVAVDPVEAAWVWECCVIGRLLCAAIPFSLSADCAETACSPGPATLSRRVPEEKAVFGLTLSSDSLPPEVPDARRGAPSKVFESYRTGRETAVGDMCIWTSCPTHGLDARFERESWPDD